MLILRRKNQLFFCFLLSIFVIYNVEARQIGASGPNCSPNGGYCQMHSDCCSGKCMTYSYICAPVLYPLVYQRPHNNMPVKDNQVTEDQFFMATQPKKSHVQTVVENRFNTGANAVEIEIATLPDNKSKTGTHALEKVDSSLLTSDSPQVDAVSNRTCKNIGNECSDNRECCSKRCHSYLHRCVT